jgi:hypothetical protein
VLFQKESSRVVTYKEGAAMAQKLQTLFVECSAKTKVGVQEAFEELVQKVIGERTFIGYVASTHDTLLNFLSVRSLKRPVYGKSNKHQLLLFVCLLMATRNKNRVCALADSQKGPI